MGVFDGILLCTDLDGTLFTNDKRVSEENSRAIEHFKAEGGKFAFATGRVPRGAALAAEYAKPNTPIICYNGAGIFDYSDSRLLWHRTLDYSVFDAVDMVCERLPQVGLEICTTKSIFYSRENNVTRESRDMQNFDDNPIEYRDITEEIIKIVFMMEQQYMPDIRRILAESEYAGEYTFSQSSDKYYEILPKGSTKGQAMLELARMLGIDGDRVVAMGDNENDIDMIRRAKVGIAVANAAKEVLSAADYIMVDNEHNAVAAVIEALEMGKIKL